jgi:hypothetical protein
VRVVAWIVGVVVAIALGQMFVRYDYVHLAGGHVMRIDRLASTSCYMPCLPPTPAPTATPFDPVAASEQYVRESEEQDQDAILLAKAAVTPQYSGGQDWEWTATTTDANGRSALAKIARGLDPWSSQPTPPPITSASFQTKLVCHCAMQGKLQGIGNRWEVHTDTRTVYLIDDNADLSKKYFPIKM